MFDDDLIEVDPPRRVGKDRVICIGDQRVIESDRDMPDWIVREYGAIRVFFEDRPYRLIRRHHGKGSWQYTLAPWEEGRGDSSADVFYGEDYVRDRERQIVRDVATESLGLVLSPLLAMVGFLPRRVQASIEARWGLSAHQATVASLWAQGAATFALALILLIQWIVGVFWVPKSMLYIVLPLLTVDCIGRTHKALNGHTLGLYEWVWTRTSIVPQDR
ncbi:MAG: hypothetical protein AB7O52_08635 [Planctomycetota bacterium]